MGAPRERKTYDKKYKVVDEIASYMFPSKSVVGGGETKYKRRKLYRNVLTRLCKSLSIPEIYMSSKKWGEINFKNVPSVCMNKLSKAFLNERIKEINTDLEKGNRHPDDADRILCRKHMIDNLAKGQINSKQLFPHEVVRKCMHGKASTSTDRLLCNVQWKGIRESVIKSLEEAKEGLKSGDGMDIDVIQANGEVVKEKVDLGKIVPLVDVSGSMSGVPMEVAIALGILVSEVNDPHFRNRFITFESNPRWISFEEDWSLEQKVIHTRRAPWGGSTDLSAALNMIYNVVEENRLSEEEIPNLIIFSDMQFNQCSRWNETMQQTIERKFARLGNTICGKPYRAPLMIYWNLRSTGGHAVQADTPNTMLLSGFSPSMLKLILEGQQVGEQEVVDEKGNVTKKSITPWEIMRLAIDSEVYDPIRSRLIASDEGHLEHYGPKVDGKEDGNVLVSESKNSESVSQKKDDDDDFEMVEEEGSNS